MRKTRPAIELTLPGMDAGPSRKPITPLARAMSLRGHKARKRTAPAPRPWECVTLNVDTAKNSGWATGVRGKLIAYGEHNTEKYPAATEIVVMQAIALGRDYKLPVIMVLEAPYGGAVYMVVALGVAKERWLKAWRECLQAKGRVVTVEPSIWRGPVLGSWAVGLPREDVRASEMSMALGITRQPALGADTAAAVCIHHWAAHAPEVGKAIGERAIKASVKAWCGQ